MPENHGGDARPTGSRRTARLLLRQPMAADLDFVTRLFARPELVAHRPDPTPDTAQQSADRLLRDIGHWREHGFGRWTIEAGGEPIGFGGLTVSQAFDGLNLSYHLRPESWGQGFATELIREALSLAFDDLHATRVIGLVRTANVASRRALEKNGFRFEREVMLHDAPTNLYVLESAGLV
ncbi:MULTISPECIES: GNAT family N-acetyltransferase [unclassified Mesorhizobium]|uniref:GNAT family N-acetyltransferase n=1 Tax=unclassified Mesorhizobium TaxID=325217 RepID=UPI001CCA6F18|nr:MULTISPECIES: GNAT family N-acetyltransferase [unclassified Mesorhizobium]MBZ9743401.1 GNAT family N-acetyltransferase [Mesorhizobium sp. CO1-1-4]MBZ9805416.1 GNAT family N-acetyltransferase [Mesorhizobium sp. ES1-6]